MKTISYSITTTPGSKALVASGRFGSSAKYNFPVAPPQAWFQKNNIQTPHGIRIDEDGRISGYVCSWNAEHVASEFSGRRPPKSDSNYAWFHIGAVITLEGETIKTGVLTADSYHPSLELNPSAVTSHYDHTGCGVADVVAHEDSYGIQLSGALRPEVTLAQARMLRASDYSPDWRPVSHKGRMGQSLEMVGIMACNMSGFITNALVASGSEAKIVVPEGAFAAGETVVTTDDEDNVVFMCGTEWSVSSTEGEEIYEQNGTGIEVPAEVLAHIEKLESRVEYLEGYLGREIALSKLEALGI